MYNFSMKSKKMRFLEIQVCRAEHTHRHSRCTHMCMLTLSTPGPPRRAHLVNLANTWAHTWLRHVATILGVLGMCQAGPEAFSLPWSAPSSSCFPDLQLFSTGPPSFPARFSESRTLWSQERQPVREGSTWPAFMMMASPFLGQWSAT